MRSERTTRRVLGAVLVTGASILAGCHAREPESPSVGLTQAVIPPEMPDLGHGAPRGWIEGTYSMYVAEPVRHECSGSVPFFAFDSSDTRNKDQPTMQNLALCMNFGALKGKSIRLIGHTDPVGTDGYNAKLGLARAERVKRYLVSHGVDAARVEVESVGEDEASPAPKDWPKDRRVEIQLAR